ncbi:aldose epimerase family protein [Deinococcus sp. Leaf326]|uniref:aldose epimerase family protein n=1 Tax=Deinococcus sp. Leaf326 TaxID=1736338 RepID=UPI0006F3DBF0|nr:aldose epimerase family protein [Deinococcus sp. Leaf326]KQR22834.1 aldose epimerase [Deinococcus sp. Leaf326]
MSVLKLSSEVWGRSPAGRDVQQFTLASPTAEVRVMTYGGVITSVRTPDRRGEWGEITLGHSGAAPYFDRATASFFGALIGRYGNRIEAGRFTLDGQAYQLPLNDGPNTLHGGPGGFDQHDWDARTEVADDALSLVLTRRSPDGEEGFPGALDVSVTYRLSADGTLDLLYRAATDWPTVVNLTNHTYWNLSGDRDVLGHVLELPARRFVPVRADMIPTGEVAEVQGTPLDFRVPQAVGARIGEAHEQLRLAGGYDHTFVLEGEPDAVGLRRAAHLSEPVGGRTLEVWTSEPGVQFYSGNFLTGQPGRAEQPYPKHWGLCLETQHYPDSPNQPQFPSTRLDPGQVYHSHTRYRFGTTGG